MREKHIVGDQETLIIFEIAYSFLLVGCGYTPGIKRYGLSLLMETTMASLLRLPWNMELGK